jgi:Zn-dependent protease
MVFGVVMMLHEIGHIFILENRIFGLRDALDFAHHGLAIWISLIAVSWAKDARA